MNYIDYLQNILVELVYHDMHTLCKYIYTEYTFDTHIYIYIYKSVNVAYIVTLC